MEQCRWLCWWQKLSHWNDCRMGTISPLLREAMLPFQSARTLARVDNFHEMPFDLFVKIYNRFTMHGFEIDVVDYQLFQNVSLQSYPKFEMTPRVR